MAGSLSRSACSSGSWLGVEPDAFPAAGRVRPRRLPASVMAILIPKSTSKTMSAPDSLTPGSPSKEDLKRAFKAFKKRLKLTRLDAESSIAGGPLSSGRSSGIVAITPPHEFPQPVWDELVRQGRLKPSGRGMYELTEE